MYFIYCDLKHGSHHESVFLENQQGESVKYELRRLLANGNVAFPYAPVIVVMGSGS